ncbi:MAG TPA: aminotransferase class IV [Nocardioides sp.]|nr:aminotransferase class IV [Nocardioides sp.]
MADGDERPDADLGVFDTLLVRGGRAVGLGAHVERLARSVRELYGVPVEAGDLASRIAAEAVGAVGLATARVRTSYQPTTRGWQVAATRIEEPDLDPWALAVRRVPGGLGRHKWTDRRLVSDPGEADDVLLLDEHGRVLECGTANVFVVLGGVVVTPPRDGRILPGTVRERVLARLRENHEPVEERDVNLAELTQATELFTTSSIRGVQPVARCADVGSWPIGPTTTWLRASLTDADA